MSDARLITRFAPSPTGELHLGNARTALFSALLARGRGGRFVLRIEDTDAARSDPAHEAALRADLRWLGLPWDGEVVRQSERTEIYRAAWTRLETGGQAYPCFCSAETLERARRAQLAAGHPPRYARTCLELAPAERRRRIEAGEPASLRFQVPAAQAVEFQDLVHGPHRASTDDLGDFVIRRASGAPSFLFANAVDDAHMRVTHVLRGDDHLSNTPRQLLLLAALGLEPPAYGHLALLVGRDGAPLSKRAGASSVRAYRESGYRPEALLNHLFRLGHSSPEQGVLEPAAMARAFDLRQLGRAPAHFDPEQLLAWQRAVVQALPVASFADWIGASLPPGLDASAREAFIAAIRPNVLFPSDVRRWADVVFGEAPVVPDSAKAALAGAGASFFRAAADAAATHGNDAAAIVAAVRAATGRKGPALYAPLRLALTGLEQGPELAPLLRAMPAAAVRARLERFA